MAARQSIYDKSNPIHEGLPRVGMFENQGLRGAGQRDWTGIYDQYGTASLPTSADVPTTGFTWPESQGETLNPYLAAATYTFFKTNLIGVMRILPVILSDRQFHTHEERYIHAGPMEILPEESTPSQHTISSERVAERSERYGVGLYHELNFTDTPQGAELRAHFLENFKICAQLTIHASAMVKLLSCSTIWHNFFDKECRNALTAESIKRLIDCQKRSFGCVYHAKRFYNLVVLAFNLFDIDRTPEVMILSRKAIPHLQQSIINRCYSIDTSIASFLDMKNGENLTTEMNVPVYSRLELYADLNEESGRGDPKPDYLFRTGVAVGQYGFFDVPIDMPPKDYKPWHRDFRAMDYKKPDWKTFYFADAIKNAMPGASMYPADSTGNWTANSVDPARFSSESLGTFLAHEHAYLVAAELTEQVSQFMAGAYFCACVVVERLKAIYAANYTLVEALVEASTAANIATAWDNTFFKNAFLRRRTDGAATRTGMFQSHDQRGLDFAGKSKKKARGSVHAIRARKIPDAHSADAVSGEALYKALRANYPDIPVHVWIRLLGLSMDPAILVQAHQAGICLPLQIYLIRPEIRFTCTSYIMAVPGPKTGYTWLGRSSFAQGANAKNQTGAASFALELGSLVKQKKNVMVLPDVEINRIESGHGSVIGPYDRFIPDEHDVLFYATGLGDRMNDHYCVPCNGSYYETNYMQELGKFEDCTAQGYISPMTQMLYAQHMETDYADSRRIPKLTEKLEVCGPSTIMIDAAAVNPYRTYIEGMDDPSRFHYKYNQTLNHMCMQMHMKIPGRNIEIFGRSFLGEVEHADNANTIFHGNFLRDEEPFPVRDVGNTSRYRD